MKKVLYNSSFEVNRKLPINYKDVDKERFIKEFHRKINPSYIYDLNNVIVTYEGIVFNRYVLLKDSLHSIHDKKYYNVKYLLKNIIYKKRVVLNDANYILTYNPWGTGYGHWITETLVRVYMIKDYLSKCIFILPKNINNNMLLSLKAFDIKDICYIDEMEYFVVPRLIMPSMAAPTGNYNENLMKELRNLYLRYYCLDKITPQRRIYMSRAKAPKRKIINEAEIINVLEKYNFETIYVEELSFEDQVRLCSESSHLISIHGATLANMLFMHDKTSVMEIKNENDYHNNCYYSLSSALNINYYYIFGSAVNIEKDNQSDIIVDKNLFENNIRMFIEDI